jgi:hypothetical protein
MRSYNRKSAFLFKQEFTTAALLVRSTGKKKPPAYDRGLLGGGYVFV